MEKVLLKKSNTKKYIKNLQEPLASFEKVLYYIKDASVAQWIEQWPPEPCA